MRNLLPEKSYYLLIESELFVVVMWNLAKFDSTAALKVPKIKRILPRYVKIITKGVPAKFQITKRVVFDFDKSMSTKKMWEEHERLVQKLRQTQLMIDKGKLNLGELEVPRFSLLDLKIMLAEDMLRQCELCERVCGANRISGETGECKVPETKNCLISSEGMHLGEEAHIVPSHTIFFMGCNFHCQFCQNWTISQWHEGGASVHPKLLAQAIKRRKGEGARNINWVGGEPTPQLLPILKTIKLIEVNTPQIWNSNFYMSVSTMRLLDGIVDMYLSDFKYGNSDCARHISKVDNYFKVCTRNHTLAAEQAELTIRHLVLPNHVDCCTKPVLKWIAKNIRTRAIVNIMDQYRPAYKAHEHIDLQRSLSDAEMEEAINYAKKLKLNYVS